MGRRHSTARRTEGEAEQTRRGRAKVIFFRVQVESQITTDIRILSNHVFMVLSSYGANCRLVACFFFERAIHHSETSYKWLHIILNLTHHLPNYT